jgi:hypothetical protein
VALQVDRRKVAADCKSIVGPEDHIADLVGMEGMMLVLVDLEVDRLEVGALVQNIADKGVLVGHKSLRYYHTAEA